MTLKRHRCRTTEAVVLSVDHISSVVAFHRVSKRCPSQPCRPRLRLGPMNGDLGRMAAPEGFTATTWQMEIMQRPRRHLHFDDEHLCCLFVRRSVHNDSFLADRPTLIC